jgi:hypothetical protein
MTSGNVQYSSSATTETFERTQFMCSTFHSPPLLMASRMGRGGPVAGTVTSAHSSSPRSAGKGGCAVSGIKKTTPGVRRARSHGSFADNQMFWVLLLRHDVPRILHD